MRPSPSPHGKAPLRVLLVGEDALARAGIHSLLGGDDGVTVVAQSGQSAGLGTALQRHQPDVVVWDVGNGEGTWPQEAPPGGPPMVLLVPDDVVGRQATGSGARGVVYRDARGTALLAAIRAVASGFHVLEQDVMDSFFPRRAQGEGAAPDLTVREREVLNLLVDGLSNKAMGARLSISEHTAKFHVTAIFGKLGVQRRSEAVARALRMGLVVL
jgi:DNA-binding NarL/FixJ family response regulator